MIKFKWILTLLIVALIVSIVAGIYGVKIFLADRARRELELRAAIVKALRQTEASIKQYQLDENAAYPVMNAPSSLLNPESAPATLPN